MENAQDLSKKLQETIEAALIKAIPVTEPAVSPVPVAAVATPSDAKPHKGPGKGRRCNCPSCEGKHPGKKQPARLLKVMCGSCGYVARVTRRWLDTSGAPLCPAHPTPMKECA